MYVIGLYIYIYEERGVHELLDRPTWGKDRHLGQQVLWCTSK